MRLRPASLIALVLAAPAWLLLPPHEALAPSSQDPVRPPVETPGDGSDEPGQLEPDKWELDEKWHGLYGTWSLMHFQGADLILPDNVAQGYASFAPGFMSLIIHARSLDGENSQFAQSGFHRFQITDQDILQTATMMAHSNFNDDAELDWETPNIPREFRISLKKDDLTLEKPDGSVLTFRRIQPLPYPQAALDLIDIARAGLEAE